MTTLFYRVLSTPAHQAHYHAGTRNSTHASPPGEWITEWARSHATDRERYPLEAFGGPYTEQARAAFLAAAPWYRDGELWSEADRVAAGELAGLCVFTSRAAARAYANGWQDERFLVLQGLPNGRCAEVESVLLTDWEVFDGPLTRREFDCQFP